MSDTKTLDNNTTVEKLRNALNENGYICGSQLATQILMAINTRPTAGGYLFGKAGTGKTYMPHVLADIFDINEPDETFFFFQCFPGTREEHLTVQLLPDEDTKSGIKKHEGVMVRAAKASVDQKVMLVIDEWDKTRPSADAFLLDFLQTGRIHYGDINVTANLENLFVFITMNDERDMSEPLLRRLPKIDFEPLDPTLVKQALYNTHGEHPYIEACVTLYRRCLASGMSKPCTVQELRQLLDAASLLGEEADWNMLVYQYVTKTPENHILLKNAEGKALKDTDADFDLPTLDSGKFGKHGMGEFATKGGLSSMPTISKVRGVSKRVTTEEKLDLSDAFGVFIASEENYSFMAKMGEPTEESDKLTWGDVRGNHFAVNRAIPMHESPKFEELWGQGGELLFTDDSVTLEDMRRLEKTLDNFHFTRFSKSEVVARYLSFDKTMDAIHIRWSPEHGAEIIASLSHKQEFKALVEGLNCITLAAPSFKALREDAFSYGVYDMWGELEWDTQEDENVPRLSDFLKIAEKDAEIEIVGDDRYYHFKNITFGFIGKNNDMFCLAVTGKFDHNLLPFVKEWAPSGAIFLYVKDIADPRTTKELLADDFHINANHTTALTKRIGRVLVGHKANVIKAGVNVANIKTGSAAEMKATKKEIDSYIDTLVDIKKSVASS